MAVKLPYLEACHKVSGWVCHYYPPGRGRLLREGYRQMALVTLAVML